MLESAGLLSCFQAGFRKGRGVSDQLVRLSQNVWDGYQRREKTCLVLFDFERAFDTVWHDGLLSKLIEMGVSRTVVRWVQEWLKNRLYWVRVDGVRGRARLFRQGLPQGSVLSPLLFLVYINLDNKPSCHTVSNARSKSNNTKQVFSRRWYPSQTFCDKRTN